MAASGNLYLEALAFFIIHRIITNKSVTKSFLKKNCFLKLCDCTIIGVSNSFSDVGHIYKPKLYAG